MYNVQIGPKAEEIQPTAETLFISLTKTEENEANADDTEEATDEEAAN